jgi:hypothetical protein
VSQQEYFVVGAGTLVALYFVSQAGESAGTGIGVGAAFVGIGGAIALVLFAL